MLGRHISLIPLTTTNIGHPVGYCLSSPHLTASGLGTFLLSVEYPRCGQGPVAEPDIPR
ncbi:hypothetical protein VPHD292_0051 [Vibrio phage D292]